MTNEPLRAVITRWGWTLSVFLLVTFLVCVAFGLLLPAQFHMHQAWEPLLPGFEWLTWPGFFAGAIGSFLYGWYIALVGVPLYRFFSKNRQSS